MKTVSLQTSAGKWIMASAILASSMAFIDATALNVVLPALQKNLYASGADLFWILNAYLLVLASLILTGGAMGDKLGRKRVFMTGIIVFILGSAACGLSASVLMLIVCRIVQGCGGALMIPGSLSLISASINDNERGKAIGTWSAFTTVVTMGGPLLGGALADAGLWRYIFYINIPIGIIALLILSVKVNESREDDGKPIDIWGAITIAACLACLTMGFLHIPTDGVASCIVILAFATGIALLVVFIMIELNSSHPMMPITLFKNATFSGANLLTFFLYAGLGASMLFLSLNLVQVQGYSQLQSGLTFLPFTILMVTTARFAGKLADKFGPRLFLIGGPVTAGAGMLMLSFVGQTSGPGDYWTTFFPGVLVFGVGMSFTVAPLTATVMGSVSNHFSGVASGVNNAMTRIAGVFANAIFGALAVLFFSSSLHTHLVGININAAQRSEVMEQGKDLGNAKVPANLPAVMQATVERAYHDSFIYAFGNIMRICAALGFLACIMTVIFIKNSTVKHKSA
jgi:EmrB/QacA subfamily drug resistance transporter